MFFYSYSLCIQVGISKGALCSNTDNPHFICGPTNTDCFSAMVTAQANDHVSFKKNGNYIICAYCTALDHEIVTPFGSAQVTKHANGPALTAYKRAVSDAAFLAPVCVLCLDNPKEIIFLPCFHKTYCFTCFEDPSVKSQSRCPYCRYIDMYIYDTRISITFIYVYTYYTNNQIKNI